jgi:hypothetical protein
VAPRPRITLIKAMKLRVVYCYTFLFVSVASLSQETTDTIDMKYIRFYEKLQNDSQRLSEKQLQAAYPVIEKYSKNSPGKKDTPTALLIKEIIKISKSTLYGITLDCDDCHYEYFLLYESPAKTIAIDENSEHSLLEKLLKLFMNDNSKVSKSERQFLKNQSFFYFEFISFFSVESELFEVHEGE